MDYGRDDIDKIVREVGNTWWEQAREVAPLLLSAAVQAAATSTRTDKNYVWWRLLNDQRTWGSNARSEMLDVAVRLTLMSVSRDHTPEPGFVLPNDVEGEQQVDKALVALVKWADTAFADKAVDLLLAVADEAAKRVQRATADMTGERISERQARLTVLVDLPERVRDHPFWFRDPISLGALMQRIMRKS